MKVDLRPNLRIFIRYTDRRKYLGVTYNGECFVGTTGSTTGHYYLSGATISDNWIQNNDLKEVSTLDLPIKYFRGTVKKKGFTEVKEVLRNRGIKVESMETGQRDL